MGRWEVLAALLGLCASTGNAQASRKVVWVVPFAPGGGTDLFVRPLIAALGAAGQDEHIVDYRPGAGGRTGATYAARAEANGQTLLVGSTHHVVGQLLFPSEESALLTAFEPVVRIASVPDVLVVPTSTGVTEIAGLTSYAASNRNSIAFASSGIGTTRHVLGETLNKSHSLGAVHIPYSGSGPAIRALLAAEAQFMFEGIGPALPHIRSGALRALAVSQKAVPSLPGVPSFEEVGIGELSATSWYGIFLPRRAAALALKQSHPRAARQDLKNLANADYAWLSHHDREWLDRNFPLKRPQRERTSLYDVNLDISTASFAATVVEQLARDGRERLRRKWSLLVDCFGKDTQRPRVRHEAL